jgi:choline monooxygenase
MRYELCWHVFNIQAENKRNGLLRKFWTYVGHVGQFEGEQTPGRYITSMLGANLPIIVTQTAEGTLRGFVNLCRHRAAILLDQDPKAAEGIGCGSFGRTIKCRYHGWEYAGTDGRLARAVSMKGVEKFSARKNGLLPVDVETMGPLIFARFHDSLDDGPVTNAPAPSAAAAESVTTASALSNTRKGLTLEESFPGLKEALSDLSLHRFVSRHSYDIKCNWKVFADNYLDGGYHISGLHPGLASQLDLSSYKTQLAHMHSLQTCAVAERRALAGSEVAGRVGPPVYSWLFPVTAINKYSHWVDVHTVRPTGPDTCTVMFDYFIDQAVMERTPPSSLAAQLKASADVQREDIDICERVHDGLRSGGYHPGRYPLQS